MMRTVACVYPCSSGLCYCFRREHGCCLSLPERRASSTALLNLFYPDHDNFWLGLIPVFRRCWHFAEWSAGFISRIWHVLYFLLLLAQVVLLCWQPWLWLNGESVSGIGLALVVADIVALIWLLTNRRLRACFNEERTALLVNLHSSNVIE